MTEKTLTLFRAVLLPCCIYKHGQSKVHNNHFSFNLKGGDLTFSEKYGIDRCKRMVQLFKKHLIVTQGTDLLIKELREVCTV